MRGEQTGNISTILRGVGSPPLARGTEYPVHIGRAYPGITPACAGNRPLRPFSAFFSRDHPRLRGEQLSTSACAFKIAGSPPLARGTVKQRVFFFVHRRITPACAGNSGKCRRAVRQWGDHPRLRGEQAAVGYGVQQPQGSPPLARGTDFHGLHAARAGGITPACAGNSAISSKPHPNRRDHPRLRGEQAVPAMPKPSPVGSPPLARGTVRHMPDFAQLVWITPACAGNRQRLPRTKLLCWDHPRLRGEQDTI